MNHQTRVKFISRLETTKKKIQFHHSLPPGFDSVTSFSVLKAYLEGDEKRFQSSLVCAFDWREAYPGSSHWNRRATDMKRFTVEDYLLIQHWINESHSNSN